MRIQRIVLEHHRDIAILGRHVIDAALADAQVAARDLFEARDHAQRGRFAAAGRTDQNDKLFILDLQIEVFDDLDVTRINLLDIFQRNACHLLPSFLIP